MNESGEKDQVEVQSGEVLPKQESEKQPTSALNILALAQQYTERPDLFLDAIEKHDPGIVKRVNQRIEENSTRTHKSRFYFNLIQASISLITQVGVALFILFCIYLVVDRNDNGFWLIIALVVFFAISQGGKGGFLSIARGLADLFRKR